LGRPRRQYRESFLTPIRLPSFQFLVNFINGTMFYIVAQLLPPCNKNMRRFGLDRPRERAGPTTGALALKRDGATAPAPVPITRRIQLKAISGAVAGNLIDFLDFAIFGLLAKVISRTFFPADDPTVALLQTMMIYASSFLIRPLGGVILGRVGDRWGRRSALFISVSGMCLVTAVTAFLPSYATAGSFATASLVVCRLAQGFFAGGEYTAATAYIVEQGNSAHRALRASFSPAAAYAGTALAVGIFTLVSALIGAENMASWGWRLMFGLGVPLGFLGLWIRYHIDESPEFLAIEEDRRLRHVAATPLLTVIRSQWRRMLLLVSILMSHTLSNYLILGFLATYLTNFVKISETHASLAIFIAQMVLMATTVTYGWVNDTVGRRPTLLAGCILVIPAMFLSFYVASFATTASAIAAAVIPVLVYPLITSGMTIGLVDMFPPEMRVTASGIAYNTGTALFGGTAPLIAAFLIDRTGTPYAVPCYVAVIALISFVSVFFNYNERRVEPSVGDAATVAEPVA
jgi:MFS transporter, MHS family, proline/betaine transporter